MIAGELRIQDGFSVKMYTGNILYHRGTKSSKMSEAILDLLGDQSHWAHSQDVSRIVMEPKYGKLVNIKQIIEQANQTMYDDDVDSWRE